MRVTRSIARSAQMDSISISVTTTRIPGRTLRAEATTTRKRASEGATDSEGRLSVLPKVKRVRLSKTISELQSVDKDAPSAVRIPIVLEPDATLIPAQLGFSFVDAKAHLIAADNRFQEMFANVKCKPFEILEPLDPFR